MEIILLQDIENLGRPGDKVSVKSGYGRNYLVPTKRAVLATKENIAEFEERRSELERQASDVLAVAEARKVKLEELSITIGSKAGDEGRLFGSIGTSDIVDAVTAAGVELERREIRLPDGPFHVTGEFEVQLHLHADVDANLKLEIVPEQE